MQSSLEIVHQCILVLNAIGMTSECSLTIDQQGKILAFWFSNRALLLKFIISWTFTTTASRACYTALTSTRVFHWPHFNFSSDLHIILLEINNANNIKSELDKLNNKINYLSKIDLQPLHTVIRKPKSKTVMKIWNRILLKLLTCQDHSRNLKRITYIYHQFHFFCPT